MHAPNAIDLAKQHGRKVAEVAEIMFHAGHIVGLDRLEGIAGGFYFTDTWQRWALEALEDDMVEINRMTTPSNMRWKIVDRATGAENAAIDWRLRVGDRVKIRLVNELDSDHPMPHPFHVHGAGRFLVLARNGVVEPNLVWKDTVLVRTGETVDILLDVTNQGVRLDGMLPWLALAALTVSLIVCLWDFEAVWWLMPVPPLYAAGLLAIGLALHVAQPADLRWPAALSLAGYALAATLVGRFFWSSPRLWVRLGWPNYPTRWPVPWFAAAQALIIAAVVALSLGTSLSAATRLERMTGPLSLESTLRWYHSFSRATPYDRVIAVLAAVVTVGDP